MYNKYVYSNFHVIKHFEINIMNRNILFCINLTLILYFLNMDEASRTKRPGKKSIWDEMTRYEMVLARGVL